MTETGESIKEQVEITAANNTAEELAVVEAFYEMRQKYKIPVFTDKMVVEAGVIPHSHPILTLNHRITNPELLNEVVSHEQLHWFFTGHENEQAYLEAAKLKYEDLGDCNYNGQFPDSFWEHLVVIWNTINSMRSQMPEDKIRWCFGGPHRPYPLTEKFIFDNFDELGEFISQFGMIYDVENLQ